jgi:ribosomal protein S18 acetylase RimI-like enzyme
MGPRTPRQMPDHAGKREPRQAGERSEAGLVQVRCMRESEVAEVSELLCRCYAWLGDHEGLTPAQIAFLKSVRGSEATVRRESQGETYLVAQDEARIVGLVAISGSRITKLYVHPARHGRGVGRTLYEAAESSIRLGGHKEVVLGAFPSAVPFYESMGLRVVGRKNPRGAMAGLTIMLMERRLEGE